MAKKTTDEAVLDLLRKVSEKKEEIKKASKKPVWQTTCTISFDPESTVANRTNIMTVREPIKLIEIYAFLIAKEENMTVAANELGFTADLTYMGYTFPQWKADLKTRADQLSLDEKKRELETLDKRVNGLVSPEQRREMELEALTKVLGE